MKISAVRLRNYKRFTDLHINKIPHSARLVTMVGPNGSGKSSVIDAFLLKCQKSNWALHDTTYSGYLIKHNMLDNQPTSTYEVARSIDIELNTEVSDWSKAFVVRSPYRHEADFSNTTLGPVKPAYETSRFQRIIDQDQAVSDNFNRLGWSALHGAMKSEPESKSLGQFRKDLLEEIQLALEKIFDEVPLRLQDLGTGISSGTFRFQKGTIEDFHYKNLSGGEKAVFDLLLDIVIKRHDYPDAIYCIDEPESHIASAIHGQLLDALLDLIPEKSQLWIATHSIGIVRRAVDMSRANDDVVFLDFSGHDFDKPVSLIPADINRNFFLNMYEVLQDDLAGLVAPDYIILCEGGEATDAKVYNRIFEDSHPNTLFVARGGSDTVERGQIISLLELVVPRVQVGRLIDRDDMPNSVREEKIAGGIRVLRRREIENYLWDKAVVRKALHDIGADEDVIEDILKTYPFLNPKRDDMKKNNAQQEFFEKIRYAKGVEFPGRNRQEFVHAHLVPALRETEEVYQELYEDVFESSAKLC